MATTKNLTLLGKIVVRVKKSFAVNYQKFERNQLCVTKDQLGLVKS